MGQIIFSTIYVLIICVYNIDVFVKPCKKNSTDSASFAKSSLCLITRTVKVITPMSKLKIYHRCHFTYVSELYNASSSIKLKLKQELNKIGLKICKTDLSGQNTKSRVKNPVHTTLRGNSNTISCLRWKIVRFVV